MNLSEPVSKQHSTMVPNSKSCLSSYPAIPQWWTVTSQMEETLFSPELVFTRGLYHSSGMKPAHSPRAGGRWRLCISVKGVEPIPTTPGYTCAWTSPRDVAICLQASVLSKAPAGGFFSKLVFSWEIIQPPESWKGMQELSEQPS